MLGCAACAGLILTALSWPAVCQSKSGEAREIGFVLHMDGAWLANGKPIAGVGAGLAAKSVISLSPATDFRSGQKYKLDIVLLDSRPIALDCASFETCRTRLPYTLPDSLVARSSVLERLHQAVQHLLFGEPERYISAISRGAGAPQQIKEGVLLLDRGRLAIGAWFQGVEPGAYTLALVNIGRENQSTANPAPLTFEWRGDRAATVDGKDLAPGLYEARLLPARSVLNQPVSQDAWVLVAAAGAYEKDAAAYGECTASSANWKQIDPPEVETFLRACLDQVAAPVPADGTAR